MKKLKIGISGFGVVGSKRFDCLINHRDAKVVSICDQKFKNQPCELEGINIYENYRELLKDEIDAIFICMPNDIAPKVTIEALQKGIHVFCEKPPGRSVYDINKVIEVYNENPSLKLMYGFNHRYHDSVVEAQKIIKSKRLGKIINLKGTYGKSKLITFDQPEWRTKRDIAGGGVLLDQGIHMLDLMRLFAGEFNEVSSFVSNTHWNHDVEDNAYALMKTKENIDAPIRMTKTKELSLTVLRDTSLRFRKVSSPFVRAIIAAPIAPTDADSVGVATPIKIEPKTSIISIKGGKIDLKASL